jgi:hypothetical protein
MMYWVWGLLGGLLALLSLVLKDRLDGIDKRLDRIIDLLIEIKDKRRQ